MGDVHQPVMVEDVERLLAPRAGDTLIDGTVGAAGHLLALARTLGSTSRIIGLDRDAEILAIAAARIAEAGVTAELHHTAFADLDAVPALANVRPDLILLDLGVSSVQLDRGVRGFSWREDAPLDMRMDARLERTAADLVATLDEQALADLIFRYGEERSSRRIAAAIVAERRHSAVTSTGQLAALIARVTGGARARIHPATRTFQALRIAVNDELGQLERGLPMLIERLAPGGRIAVISFHSLEDRIVKQVFREHARAGRVELLCRKPVRPDAAEVAHNRRSRSARLRGAVATGAQR